MKQPARCGKTVYTSFAKRTIPFAKFNASNIRVLFRVFVKIVMFREFFLRVTAKPPKNTSSVVEGRAPSWTGS